MTSSTPNWQCPLPLLKHSKIKLAHGGGGRLMQELMDSVFLPAFDNSWLNARLDSALLLVNQDGTLAFTTDSYVIHPLFFPGGNIGSLAIHGTVNDLAMVGAVPQYISVAFILEQGLDIEVLWNIVQSMREAAEYAQVAIVTGDTKVVDHGKGDGVYITTSGIGLCSPTVCLSPESIQIGDKLIVSGAIAEHGIAIMSAREGLNFQTETKSDSASLNHLVDQMLKGCSQIRLMRDPTRGGISSTLNEIASLAKVGFHLSESSIPLKEHVKGACEMLGLDPLYVANEGKLLAIVAPEEEKSLLEIMRQHPLGKEATCIGEVVADEKHRVTMKTIIGSHRIVDMLSGEQLPRIC